MAVAQGLCSLQALLQQDARNGRFIGLEELVILERPLDGFVINLHIRQQFEQPGLAPQLPTQTLDLPPEIAHAFRQFRAIRLTKRNSRRRNGPDFSRHVIHRPIGKCRSQQSQGQKKGETA